MANSTALRLSFFFYFSLFFSLAHTFGQPEGEELLELDEIFCGDKIRGTTLEENDLFDRQIHKQEGKGCDTRPNYTSPGITYIKDVGYKFVVKTPLTVDFKLTSKQLRVDFDLFLYQVKFAETGEMIFDIDGCRGSSASESDSFGAVEKMKVNLDTGTYFVVIEEAKNIVRGSFELEVTCDYREIVCGERIEANNCFVWQNFDLKDYRDCLLQNNTDDFRKGDHLYKFSIEEEKSVLVKLQHHRKSDLDLFLLDSAPGNIPRPGACLDAIATSDTATFVGDTITSKEILIDLPAGEYWIVVEGLDPADSLPLPVYFDLSLNCFKIPTVCDREATFIDRGNTVFGSFADFESKELFFDNSALKFFDCVTDLYPDFPRFGKVYIYFHEGSDPFTIQLQEQTNTSNSLNAIVFTCNFQLRQEACLGSTAGNNGLITIDQAEQGFYYILVAADTEDDYQLAVLPEDNCQADANLSGMYRIPIPGTVKDRRNDFDLTSETENPYLDCYVGNRVYDGEDIVYFLEFTSDQIVNYIFTLESQDTSYGIFLYDYLCAKTCLDYAEITAGKMISPELTLPSPKKGIYYLVVDYDGQNPTDDFTLKIDQRSSSTSDSGGGCSSQEAAHKVVFHESSALSITGKAQEVVLTFPRNDRRRVSRQFPVSWFGMTPTSGRLEEKLLPINAGCGFNINDGIAVRAKESTDANARFIELSANFLPVGEQNEVTAVDAISPGETSLIINLTIDSTGADPKLSTIPSNRSFITGLGQDFFINIQANKGWNLLRDPNDPNKKWITVSPLRGEGDARIQVELEENDTPSERSDTIRILSAGLTWEVRVSQSNEACIDNPINLSFESEDKFPPSCPGDQDGRFVLKRTGGVGPFDYQWEGPTTIAPGDTTPTDLSSGTYLVSVTDSRGCQSRDSIFLPEPIPLEAVLIDSGMLICPTDSTLKLSVEASGGTGTYVYNWNTEDITPFIDSVGAGFYEVEVRDGNECQIFLDTTIIAPDYDLAFDSDNTMIDSVRCWGFDDGRISPAATGGVLPYNYAWDHQGRQGSIIDSLPAGQYAVTLTDGNNCSVDSSFTVLEPPELVVSIDIESTINCLNNTGRLSDGSFGGTAPLSRIWSWSNSSSTDRELTNVEPNVEYSLLVTDNNGCSGSDMITLSALSDLRIDSIIGTNVSCFDTQQADGTAEVFISGGNAPQITWSDERTTSAIAGLSEGTYSVTVTDLSPVCIFEAQVTIERPDPLSLSITTFELGGDGQGEITVEPMGGTPGYRYVWNHQAPNTNFLNSLDFGIYQVTVIDTNDCRVSGFGIINPPQCRLDTLDIGVMTIGVSSADTTDGTAMITGLVDDRTFTIDWSTGLFADDALHEGLALRDDYSVTVTTDQGCLWYLPFSIGLRGTGNNQPLQGRATNAGHEEEFAKLIPYIAVEKMLIFPNPAKDRLNIRWKAEGTMPRSLELWSLDGRKVLEMKSPKNQSSIAVGHLPPGTYLLRIQLVNKQILRKIVIE